MEKKEFTKVKTKIRKVKKKLTPVMPVHKCK